MRLDVAKGESQIQAFLARKQPFGKTFKFKHDTNGLRLILTKLLSILRQIPPIKVKGFRK